MRVGILGDIHGNAPALRAVLRDIKRQGIRRLLITGDFVGYYYYPGDVLALLEGWSYEAVQGNHEAMLGSTLQDPDRWEDYRRRFGSGLACARAQLAPSVLAELVSLPARRDVVVDGRRIVLCHGSPWDRDTYVYPDAGEDVLRCCVDGNGDVVAMGHTHHPMVRMVDGTLLVNPGSVGQPRDGDPRAAWAVLDVETLTAHIRRVSYPADALAVEARERDPQIQYLADVLLRRGTPSGRHGKAAAQARR